MKTEKGFTLVEILIVVVILGILAAIVVPSFSSASQSSRAGALAEDLRVVRTQLAVYEVEHDGIPPGYPTDGGAPDQATFFNQMILSTDQTGQTGPVDAPAFPYGPYWVRPPTNPINGLDTVNVLDDGEPFPAAPTDLFGWVYKPATLAFKSDAIGQDPVGEPFFDY